MADIAALKGTPASGTLSTMTATLPSAPNSTYWLVAFVRVLASTSPPTIVGTGWTLSSSAVTSSEWQGVYVRRGDGTTNSISFTTGGLNHLIHILAYSGAYSSTLPTSITATSVSTSVNSLASGTYNTTEANMAVSAFLSGHASTLSSIAFTGYPSTLGNSGTTFGWVDDVRVASGASAATTGSFTGTARRLLLSVVRIPVVDPSPPPTDTTPPSVPTGFTIAGRTATSITIDWADSTDAVGTTGYEVFRGGVSIATPTSSVYTDTGRAYDTSYSYTVRARDAAGNWSAQSSAFVARTIGNERRYDGAGIPDNTVIVPNVTAGTGDTPFQEVNTGGAPYWDADLGEMVFGSASTPIHYVRWKDFNFTGPWSIQAYYTWTGSATSTGVHFLYAMDAAGGREWSLTTASGGALIARDTLSNIIGTASPAQVPGTRYRIAVFGVAGAPDIHVRMYEYGSGTPIWTSDISNIGTSSAPGIIEFGRHGTTAMGTVYRVAHFATEALAGIIDPIETTPEVELFLWTEARTLSIPIELLGVLT